jgi:UDP-glucose 4-epimerase
VKILVSGGAGFIASHVVDLYIAHNHEVVILDDLSTGRISNLNPRARFIKMDIRNPQVKDIFETEQFDVVNHHAAQMDVRRSTVEPLFDAEVNILGSLNLIMNAQKFGVKHFVYVSSGGAAYGEPVYMPCDENHPIDPICQYGVSKHTVEHYLFLYYINYGMEYTVLRYPNVYGPRQDPNGEAGVVAIFTGQMLNDMQVYINGDGEQERDFVFVSDCAKANYLAITQPHPSGIYNLGSSCGTTINKIFQHLQKITNYSREPIYRPAKLGETRKIYLDATKVQKELGWAQDISLKEGLNLTVDYFKQKELSG